MKYITAALALAASVLAAPAEKRDTCQFGTYRCTTPNTGIEICDIQGNWELVGPCPDGTSCNDLPQNGFDLPFCTANTTATNTVKARNGRGPSPGDKCDTPGKYQCFGAYAIQVCDTQNKLEFVGNCPEKSHCDYINNIPYCVASV
ncbi:352a710f-3feb-4955-aa85-e02fded2d529 [Thermothielavioides terrestris]|uniref:Carbohydrate-binding module family 19 domain-containing protein n=2 Tax=Thermothielavioides terrestris TaxID=2587410 RepID=G2R8G1_THETT|nr:uncharacterized protein THITE_2170708 [Thermothielavioides terrestris NRRL 8126]AEO68219.1 hypothetical protein THITE_2170708 [Thermothielavioides terrestris NRRL 8126]SPQ24528.1 352a710f-3feb-4955-aa85-e02fded2d529 [Thermothielavioides terrestris]